MRLLILVLLLLSPGPAMGQISEEADQGTGHTLELFDFTPSEPDSWRIVNDGVMGGRSKGYVSIDYGVLTFSGVLVTRGGGFTSVRTPAALNLEGFDGIELLVRGSGRKFELEVSDGERFRGRTVSRRAPFPTSADWEWVRVPFDALQSSIFGNRVRTAPLDPVRVGALGIFLADAIDGEFELQIGQMRAYRDQG
ncbi:MAG: CIA30 family protein [Rhodothermales bacterium]|nr:CIA30 family protein [Rhodothermales bacterium]